jgi:hypothetical protein
MPQQINYTPFQEQYEKYMAQILSDLGLQDLSEPLRSRLANAIEQHMSQVVLNTILKNLDDNAISMINDMLEQGKAQEEILIYLSSSIPGIDSKLAKATNDAYQQLLSESRQLAASTINARSATTTPDDK